MKKSIETEEAKVSRYLGLKEILATPPLVLKECTFWRGTDSGKIELLRKELKEKRPEIKSYLRKVRKRVY